MDAAKARPEIMIDIETLGTKPGSVIASIAALVFDQAGNVLEYLDVKLDIIEQTEMGLTIDPATVLWWFKQSDSARNATFFADDAVPPMEGLDSLYNLVKHVDPAGIWAHSPVFDIVLLEHAFDAFGLRPPWGYKVILDTRTLYDLAGIDLKAIPFDGEEHDAYADALHQITGVIEARERLVVGSR